MILNTYWYSAKFNDKIQELYTRECVKYVNGKPYQYSSTTNNIPQKDWKVDRFTPQELRIIYDDWTIVHNDNTDGVGIITIKTK